MGFSTDAYLRTFKDVDNWWKDAKKKGIAGGKGIYYKQHGRDTSGWEKGWLKGMNKKYKTDKTDVGQFSRDEYAKYHYDTYGKKEKRLKNKDYKKNYAKSLEGTSTQDAKVDLTTFQTLLNKLEGSKKRQQRQKSVEGRRDIYAGGLASMMTNF